MKALSSSVLGLVVGAVLLAWLAPTLIALATALLPLIMVSTVAIVAVRLVFFHTRKW